MDVENELQIFVMVHQLEVQLNRLDLISLSGILKYE